MKAHSYRQYLVNKNEAIYCSHLLFPGSALQPSFTRCHTSQDHVCCLVISHSFRLSLEDPDTGHENDHEPKLTMPGAPDMANFSSSSSDSSGDSRGSS